MWKQFSRFSLSWYILLSLFTLQFHSPFPWRSCWASGCWSHSGWRLVDSPGPQMNPSGWSPALYRRSSSASPGEGEYKGLLFKTGQSDTMWRSSLTSHLPLVWPAPPRCFPSAPCAPGRKSSPQTPPQISLGSGTQTVTVRRGNNSWTHRPLFHSLTVASVSPSVL